MQLNFAHKCFSLLVTALFLFATAGYGQDSHYYSMQPDSKGSLSGGTGTAGIRVLSAVFYNPGIISLFTESSIGLSGRLFSVDFVAVRDGAGQLRDLQGSSFQVVPSIFAGTFKSKKNKKLTMAYAYLNTGFYNNHLSAEFAQPFTLNGKNLYAYNKYDVRTRYSEDWIGAGVSYRINENWGVGVVPYVHLYSIQFMQRAHLDIASQLNADTLVQGLADFRESRLFSPGLAFNMGLVYTKGDHEFGLTVITPRINVMSLAYSSVERSNTAYSDTAGVLRDILDDQDFKARIKRPLEVNLGYAYLHNNQSFKVRLSFYSKVDKYVMGQESENSIRLGRFKTENEFDYLPVTSNQFLVNVGFGYEWNVKKDLRVVTGYRTDFSYFNKGDFDYIDFTTVLIHWNLHHLSAGIDWKHKWLKLNTGLDYAFSYQKGLSQFVDLESLLGEDKDFYSVELSDNAQVRYHQFKVFIGLVLYLNQGE